MKADIRTSLNDSKPKKHNTSFGGHIDFSPLLLYKEHISI